MVWKWYQLFVCASRLFGECPLLRREFRCTVHQTVPLSLQRMNFP